MAPPVHELIVAGVRRPAADGATFTTYNPATGKPLAEVAQAGRADLDDALDAAQAGFADGSGEWASTSATERGKVLARAAQLIRERADEFAETEVADALTVLDGMERDLLERSVLSERIRPAYVDLRSHINLVKERLERRKGNL